MWTIGDINGQRSEIRSNGTVMRPLLTGIDGCCHHRPIPATTRDQRTVWFHRLLGNGGLKRDVQCRLWFCGVRSRRNDACIAFLKTAVLHVSAIELRRLAVGGRMPHRHRHHLTRGQEASSILDVRRKACAGMLHGASAGVAMPSSVGLSCLNHPTAVAVAGVCLVSRERTGCSL